MKIVGWAIIYKGVIYDFATNKDDLFRMWTPEPIPLYTMEQANELVIPSLNEGTTCH